MTMIPKNIISIWIGGDMPELVKGCVATHKLEGYNHIWVDNGTSTDDLELDDLSKKYIKDCIEARRYAKAVDFLRMVYLERYGGIYLDSDIEVLKNFDDVLDTQFLQAVLKFAS